MQRSAAVKLAEFEDRFGETKTIVSRRGPRVMAVRRDSVTVSIALGRIVAKRVGESVRKARIKAGMTMQALADAAGLKGGKQAILHIETAMDGGVRFGTLYALGRALAIDPLKLLPAAADVFTDAPIAVSTEPRLVVED